MKNLLVTLLSDQTIPNVQFIKEKRDENTYFLFVSTTAMEIKGVQQWIKDVCSIPETNVFTKIVKPFLLIDIEDKLNELNYDEYEKIYVNVTGGTKIMSHTATEFFKELGAEIYYLTGENKIIQVYPKKKQSERNILNQVTLKEYVESYGFSMREGHLSNIPFDFTQAYFKLFLTLGEPERRVINELRKRRSKAAIIDDFSGLRDFLCTIKFPLTDPAFLTVSKKEVKYLTGDWLEEYVYFMIKRDLKIADENIKTGIVLEKKGIPNEFDVVFILNGSLYTIECKTSIVDKSEKSSNILNDTIYKVTALQKNLGLHSKFSIFTLSSKDQEVKDAQLERGKLFNINVFCRQDIAGCDDFSRLLR